MKRVNVSFEMPVVEFEGDKYRCMISMMELRAAVAEFMQKIYSAHADNADEIRAAIECGCALVDKALGDGAMLCIAGGKPVSLPYVMKIVNTIMDAVNSAYAKYVKTNYAGVHR